MIVDKEIIILECSDTLPHLEHSWRTGFMWFRKHTCQGVTHDQFSKYMEMKFPSPKPPHKHRLEYKPSQRCLWAHPDRYVWTCKDQACNSVISIDKREFRWALLCQVGVVTAKKLPPMRDPWPSN